MMLANGKDPSQHASALQALSDEARRPDAVVQKEMKENSSQWASSARGHSRVALVVAPSERGERKKCACN